MVRDALRFDGEVLDAAGASLGEARFWGSAERLQPGTPWCGWLRLADLGRTELPSGRYRVRTAAGWEAEFEPVVRTAARVFEIDLLPIQGIGAAPWPDASDRTDCYRPAWSDTPPRTADDRTHFPTELGPLGLTPSEGLLPPGMDWAPLPGR